MLSTTLRRSLATLGVAAGLLAAAGPASAGESVTSGLGETAQRHVTDGTSNTLESAVVGQARGSSPADALKYDTDVVDY